jgi:hypothetical protein
MPISENNKQKGIFKKSECTVLTSSEHINNNKNKKDLKANKNASSKNRIKKIGSHILRSTKYTGQDNTDSKYMYCNGFYSEDQRGGIWI